MKQIQENHIGLDLNSHCSKKFTLIHMFHKEHIFLTTAAEYDY